MATIDVFLPLTIHAIHQIKGKDGAIYTHCVVDEADAPKLKAANLLTWDSDEAAKDAPEAIKVNGKIAHEFFGSPVERKPTSVGTVREAPVEEPVEEPAGR